LPDRSRTASIRRLQHLEHRHRFTYKVFTLDLRYSDTNLSKGDCNAFTSAFNGSGTNNITQSTRRVGSNWCGAAGIAKLSADLTG